MPTTLSKGFKIPLRGERGDTVFDALEDNIQRTNDHTHNGTDSQALSPKYFTKDSVTLALADWTAVVGQTGTFKQTLTVPAGYTVDGFVMKFTVGSGSEAGTIIHPSVVKLTATTADVYINDSSIDVKVLFA